VTEPIVKWRSIIWRAGSARCYGDGIQDGITKFDCRRIIKAPASIFDGLGKL
jgi:hypothetical protein